MCFLCFGNLFIFCQELTSFHLKLQWPALPGAKSNKRKSSAIIGALVCRIFHGTKCRGGRFCNFSVLKQFVAQEKAGEEKYIFKISIQGRFCFFTFVANSFAFLLLLPIPSLSVAVCCQLAGFKCFLVAFYSRCLLSLLPWIPVAFYSGCFLSSLPWIPGAFYPGCFLSSLPFIDVAFYLPQSTGAPAAKR